MSRRAQARQASLAAQKLLTLRLPGVSEVADVSRQLGQRQLARADIVEIPTVLEALGPGPGGAIAIDLLGIGERVSAGDLKRLRTRLHACTSTLQSRGIPIPLGAVPGADLNLVTQAIRFALSGKRDARSIRTITQAHATLQQAGYAAGLLDPRLVQEGPGGPALQGLQRALREAA